MTKMFPFITDTVNPIAGGPCPFGCSYCWATALKNKHQWKKYQGEYRLVEKELREYPPKSFIFVQDMGDIGDPNIPDSILNRIWEWIEKQPQSEFLLLTKNPDFYMRWWRVLPRNVLVGATIETNRRISISKALDPKTRLNDLINVKETPYFKNKQFISIEPIMDFDSEFLDYLIEIRPWAVAVGYDNYSNGLPEPELPKTRKLIQDLRDRGILVFEKTLREAHSPSRINQDGEKNE